MRKWTHLFLAAVLALAATTAHAQISQEIVNIMKKSQAVLDNPSGVEMVMSIRSGMGPLSMTTNMTTYSKGDKSLILMSMKILGREIKTEVGCDGTQVWKYKSRIKTKDVDRRDTLFISPAKKGNKISGGNEIDFNLHEEYRKATMKEKTDYYEITFTEPKDKEMPKKSIMRIRKNNYHFYEMESKQSGVSVRMTASKIKFGVSDNIFKLDMKKFPGATVIRK